ncbi:uridine diphosphate glucose pyrophosphatase [Galendromus occidentalis]|uniref:Uridine diphosphate glucose pyrophosphatase NUDT14 n=1 Tax=Galendromus occidentalis TaxID=34638 RepID=A0AAJ6QQ32_9ACAR|nr:uridine diphosphate glucose pyrophosphatase [Galendromus occidentalis]
MFANARWLLRKRIMDQIRDVRIVECKESVYVKPYRLEFTQNGRKRAWDLCKTHDSVACVVYNSSREKLLLVSQFRPAIYMNRILEKTFPIDTTKYPGSLGLTLELCAGITDKDKSLEQTMQEELEEEIGYKVPLDRISKITSYRSGVGTQGACQTLYYADVKDEDKVSTGGGNESEGEMIQVIELSTDEARNVIFDESVMRTPSMLFGLQWWFAHKFDKR